MVRVSPACGPPWRTQQCAVPDDHPGHLPSELGRTKPGRDLHPDAHAAPCWQLLHSALRAEGS